MTTRATQEDGLRYGELLRALDTLPKEQSSVLLLVSVEGLSYAETAKVLDVPIGTVMSRLSRGREKLLNLIQGDVVAPARPALRRVK
ncbi:sigma factor-like helix-turn-helix DNA-binding protein [Klebsiella pneumoniae]|uniref:sigma factor-like helix-turn-helix DNA-binding protein n=1 Tax=Klebsiella pneumoniae TaxID=573 RepID=UPI003F76C55B